MSARADTSAVAARIARLELHRPLKQGNFTADQLDETNWEPVDKEEFRRLWQAEVDEAASSLKQEQLISRPACCCRSGTSCRPTTCGSAGFARAMAAHRSVAKSTVFQSCVASSGWSTSPPSQLMTLCRRFGLRPSNGGECDGKLTLKRSLVNGRQRLELTGWIAALLDWYKAQGCFTESIRYQSRLFVPLAESAPSISALRSSRVLPNGIQ